MPNPGACLLSFSLSYVLWRKELAAQTVTGPKDGDIETRKRLACTIKVMGWRSVTTWGGNENNKGDDGEYLTMPSVKNLRSHGNYAPPPFACSQLSSNWACLAKSLPCFSFQPSNISEVNSANTMGDARLSKPTELTMMGTGSRWFLQLLDCLQWLIN